MRSALEKLSLEQCAGWTGGLGKVGTSISLLRPSHPGYFQSRWATLSTVLADGKG